MKIRPIALLFLVFLSGCSTTVFSTDTHRFGSEKLKEHSKEGKTCNYRILFFSSGHRDFTIDSARKSAGIDEIVFVENTATYVTYIPYVMPALFLKECIIVKGN